MGEEFPAPRALVTQGRPKRVRAHRDQQEVALAGKVFRSGFADLRRLGEMNEAVLHIDRRPGEGPGTLGLTP